MASENDLPASSPPPAPGSDTTLYAASRARTRVPLGRNRGRLSFDLRLRLWLVALAVPTIVCAGLLSYFTWASVMLACVIGVAIALAYALSTAALFEGVTRPLQTLSNVVAALREDDFSFRARGARRGDSLGDLALEINSLAATLQAQRGSARDALTLAERVMHAMPAPVLAFAPDRTLRLINPAGRDVFALTREPTARSIPQPVRPIGSLGLERLLEVADGGVYSHPTASGVAGERRWSVRRSTFRLGGVPHDLLVLSDVDAALREEERIAWQRLIRVLSHEINNSLTPITSLAASLRARLPDVHEYPDGSCANLADLHRGLHLIEDRGISLHRFIQAYQQLARLPHPNLQLVSIPALISRVVALETRLRTQILPGPEIRLSIDAAQIEQLMINLLGNAVEAALESRVPDRIPEVEVTWSVATSELVLHIDDNGPGLSETANLFVPFYTTKPGGSGIGLVLAQQIAQAHRGSLKLMNRQDSKGCRAELRLPCSGATKH